MRCAVRGAGEEVVHAQDVAAVGDKALAQVRAEEAGAAGDEDACAGVVCSHWRESDPAGAAVISAAGPQLLAKALQNDVHLRGHVDGQVERGCFLFG